MRKRVFVKIIGCAIILLISGTNFVCSIGKTEKQLINSEEVAPIMMKNIESHQCMPFNVKENFFYGYVVNPPPNGPINLSSMELLGPGINPNFIAGADIDNYGHWYGVANIGGLYLIGFDGTMTFIGNTPSMNGLCFDSTTQTWYGSGDHNLYTVDISTGQTMLLGQDGIPDTIIGLACDNDGNIYGYNVGGMSILYLFNKSDGSATAIGPMGVGFYYAQDPAYDRDNSILYIAGYTQIGESGLYICDVNTGAVTLLGFFPNNMEIDGFAISWTPTTQPPEPPIISGPTNGIVYVAYVFSIGPFADPEGDSLYCKWDWGDGNITEWLGPYPSGSTISASHAWTLVGVYEIRAKLRDSGEESNWSEPHIMTITEDQPPVTPLFNGPVVGRAGVTYNFTITVTDPEGNQFFYLIDWGDGNMTGWLGPYDSGAFVKLSHAWNEVGTYLIGAKAKDSQGAESNIALFTIQIVELKKSILIGVFYNQSETEDLRIIDTKFLIIFPSDSIVYHGVPIVIAKNYRFGFFISSLFGGIFEATVLTRNS